MSVKENIKKAIPKKALDHILKAYRILFYPIIYRQEQKTLRLNRERQAALVEKIRKEKRPIRVAFFALMDSVWKVDVLYRLMEQDDRFEPLIFICPVVNYGRDNMLNHMDKCERLFKSRGYNVKRSYDVATDAYIDIRKAFNPDVIFYTNPYKGLIDDRYYIDQFPDILTCYSSYYFPESNEYFWYDQPLMNLVWKRYVETEWMVEISKKYTKGKGLNCVNTTYPGFDTIVPGNTPKSDPWKIKDRSIKRIIWAPHHTIAKYAVIEYSTFLEVCDWMLEFADRYKDKIQIAFKPHPVLKNRLDITWGKEKADEYYRKWNDLPNGMLSDGAYEDLFLTSDAIMHDCGSFIGEYLVTEKPALYLTKGDIFKLNKNEIAKACLSNYYLASNKNEIESFIQNVINGEDPKKDQRISFVRSTLLPSDGKLASEKILEDLAMDLIGN